MLPRDRLRRLGQRGEVYTIATIHEARAVGGLRDDLDYRGTIHP